MTPTKAPAPTVAAMKKRLDDIGELLASRMSLHDFHRLIAERDELRVAYRAALDTEKKP